MKELNFISLTDLSEVAMSQAEVEVPEWDGKVLVRGLTVRELERIIRQSTNQKTKRTNEIQLTCMIVATACVEPKFAPGQWKMLMGKTMGPINRIAEKINQLSGTMGSEEIVVYCPECDHKFLIDENGNLLGES